jgi:hypothetical protein
MLFDHFATSSVGTQRPQLCIDWLWLKSGVLQTDEVRRQKREKGGKKRDPFRFRHLEQKFVQAERGRNQVWFKVNVL